MKKLFMNLLAAVTAGLLVSASAQPAPDNRDDTNAPPPPDEMAPPPGGDAMPAPPEAGPADDPNTTANASVPAEKTVTAPAVILPGTNNAVAADNLESNFMPPAEAAGTNNPDELRMNFRNAPLDMVLNYLSDAAGFIIVLDTRVNGNVSVISDHPMTRDEAVNLLNDVLNKNGYATIRDGRTLTILDKNEAKTRDIPVKTGNNPVEIPNNDEMATWIIPIRFVEARQLVADLTSFVSPQATVVANEEGNSIVITDTQANIRHLAEIIKAIDDSAEAETEIRVFRLKYASPADVASELTSIFPSSGSGTQSPIRFGGVGGGGGRGGFFAQMLANAGGGGGNSSNDRIKKATQVTAVPDSRIQAVIVTAPKDLMEQIAGMMSDLDVSSTRDQKVYVFHMNNGDPQQAAQMLQNMFQTSGSRGSGSSSSQNSALMQRAQNNTTATSSSTSSGTSSMGGAGGGPRTGGGAQF
jgi:general secretion pathway protein D